MTLFQEIRESKGLSRREAAEILSMSESVINNVETGRTEPRAEHVVVMAEKYKAPELYNYFCSCFCPVGKELSVPYLSPDDTLCKIAVNISDDLKDALESIKRFREISDDDRVDASEKMVFDRYCKTLNSLLKYIETLRLRCMINDAGNATAAVKTEDTAGAQPDSEKNIFRRARNNAGLSQTDAAYDVNLPVKQLSALEKGTTDPRPFDIVSMAYAYKTPQLCNYYCSHYCKIGRALAVPDIDIRPLNEIADQTEVLLTEASDVINAFFHISRDNKISKDEEKQLSEIRETLDLLSVNIRTLNLACRKRGI